jgi:hypothetical protein
MGSDADAIATPDDAAASAASAATWERLRRFFACFGSAAASVARSIRFFFNFCRFFRSRSFAASTLARFSKDTDGAAAVATTFSFPANAIAFFFSRLSRRTRLRLEMPSNPEFLLRVPLVLMRATLDSAPAVLINGFGVPGECEAVEREFGRSIPAAISDPEAVRNFGGKRSCLPILRTFNNRICCCFKVRCCSRVSSRAACHRVSPMEVQGGECTFVCFGTAFGLGFRGLGLQCESILTHAPPNQGIVEHVAQRRGGRGGGGGG